MAKLGATIDEYRRAKKVSITTICAETGISKSTYNRFVNDQASLTLGAFLNLVRLLTLDLDELSQVGDVGQLERARLRVIATVDAGNAAEYVPLINAMQAAYIKTKHPGFAQLASVMVIYHRAAIGADRLAREAAAGLWHTLMHSRLWLTFDRTVFELIAAWLDFDALDQACWERLGRLPAEVASGDRLGLVYLEAAVATADKAAVASACAWLQAQPLVANRLDGHPLRRFAELLATLVADEDTRPDYALFHQHYQALFATAGWLARYDQVWTHAQATAFVQRPPRAHYALMPLPAARADLDGVLDWVRRGRGVSVEEVCNLVGISKSTWHRLLRRLMNCKMEVFGRILPALSMNYADLQALWTGAASELDHWLENLATIGTTAGAVDEQVATFAAALKQLPLAYPPRVVTLLHMEAEIAAGEALGDAPRIQRAVATIWTRLNELEGWSRFEYQVLIPTIEYLDYTKVRLFLSRYLGGSGDLGKRLPAALVDVLGTELLVGALRSQSPVNILDVLKVIAALAAKHHGLNFVIGQRFATMVQATLVDQPDAALAGYQQTRAALRYFATSAEDSALVQMLDWLWGYLATKS